MIARPRSFEPGIVVLDSRKFWMLERSVGGARGSHGSVEHCALPNGFSRLGRVMLPMKHFRRNSRHALRLLNTKRMPCYQHYKKIMQCLSRSPSALRPLADFILQPALPTHRHGSRAPKNGPTALAPRLVVLRIRLSGPPYHGHTGRVRACECPPGR